MDLSILGLTPSEEKIFGVLLEKQATATELSKLTHISPSNIYVALEKLIQRGIITKLIINARPLYRFNGHESLQRIFDELDENYNKQKIILDKLQSDLKNVAKITNVNHNVQIFIGLSNLRSAHKIFFETNGDEFYFFYKYEEHTGKIVHDFFAKLDVNNYYKHIPTKALFSKNYETLFKKRKNAKFEAKFTAHPIPSSLNIYGDKVLLISWSTEPIAFLLRSQEIADNFKTLFLEIWEKTH